MGVKIVESENKEERIPTMKALESLSPELLVPPKHSSGICTVENVNWRMNEGRKDGRKMHLGLVEITHTIVIKKQPLIIRIIAQCEVMSSPSPASMKQNSLKIVNFGRLLVIHLCVNLGLI